MSLLQFSEDTLGTATIITDKVLSSGNDLIQTTSSEPSQQYYLLTLLITAFGAFIGVLGAFWVTKFQEKRQKKQFYKGRLIYILDSLKYELKFIDEYLKNYSKLIKKVIEGSINKSYVFAKFDNLLALFNSLNNEETYSAFQNLNSSNTWFYRSEKYVYQESELYGNFFINQKNWLHYNLFEQINSILIPFEEVKQQTVNGIDKITSEIRTLNGNKIALANSINNYIKNELAIKSLVDITIQLSRLRDLQKFLQTTLWIDINQLDTFYDIVSKYMEDESLTTNNDLNKNYLDIQQSYNLINHYMSLIDHFSDNYTHHFNKQNKEIKRFIEEIRKQYKIKSHSHDNY